MKLDIDGIFNRIFWLIMAAALVTVCVLGVPEVASRSYWAASGVSFLALFLFVYSLFCAWDA